MREVLVIPLDEVKKHFAQNERQDIKIVAPEILSSQLAELLESRGRKVKKEMRLGGDVWSSSGADEANKIVESGELELGEGGGMSVTLANEKAMHEPHYHASHSEIFFSEHRMVVRYRHLKETQVKTIELSQGGVVIFAPNIVHDIELGGITVVFEFPAVKGDKVVWDL